MEKYFQNAITATCTPIQANVMDMLEFSCGVKTKGLEFLCIIESYGIFLMVTYHKDLR